MKISKNENWHGLNFYYPFFKEKVNSALITGEEQEIENILVAMLAKLQKKYDIYFITEGNDINYNNVAFDLAKNVCFEVINRKLMCNVDSWLYIKIKNRKNILSAIEYWTDDCIEHRMFTILPKKTKVQSILDIYNNPCAFLFNIFEYYDFGFYMLYNDIINIDELLSNNK
jgi:hypothetical protein